MESTLKSKAWNSLKKFYWIAFLVCLLFFFAQSPLSLSVYEYSYQSLEEIEKESVVIDPNTLVWYTTSYTRGDRYITEGTTVRYGDLPQDPKPTDYRLPLGASDHGNLIIEPPFTSSTRILLPLNNTVFYYLGACFVVFVMWAVFIGGVFSVGMRKHFIEGARGAYRFKDIFSGYRSGKWLSISLKIFVTNVIIAAGYILLVVPGVVFHYRFRMVPYLLADDPKLSLSGVLKTSSQMTAGSKGRLFVLDMSFIGWYLLSVVTFGIAWFFFMPYYEATYAQVYLDLNTDNEMPLNIAESMITVSSSD